MGCNTSHEKSGAPGEEENAENEANNEINNEAQTKDASELGKDEIASKKCEMLAEIKEKFTNGPTSERNEKDNHSTKSSVVLVNGDGEPHENGIAAQEDEEEAAVKIQAAFRGHKVRATMKQGDNNSSSASAATTQPQTQQDDNPSKEELEAEFDPNDKQLCHAATRIQATFRGHMSRKDGTGAVVVKDEKDLQDITKKVAEELDLDMSDPELNKAAVMIQASFRGHKVRRDQN